MKRQQSIENPEPKDLIVTITSYLPIITVMALGYGIINNLVYYSYYGFNVYDYTEINELAVNTINNLIIYILPILILIGVLFYIIHNRNLKKLQNLSIEDKLEFLTSETKRQNKSVKILYISMTLSTIINVSLCLYFRNDFKGALLFIISNILLIFNFFFFDGFKKTYKYLFGKEIEQKVYIFIFSIIIIYSTSVITGMLRANFTRNKYNLGIAIQTATKFIKPSKTYYYIGKTKNYIFYYDEKIEYVEIIPMKDVTRIFYVNN